MWSPLKAIFAAALVALPVFAQAEIATFAPDDSSFSGISFAVNVPPSTAESGNGPIYLQMAAPSGIRWLGLGQGDEMTGSNMFFIYSSADDNVTLSPRLGKGHLEPKFSEDAQVELLQGTEMSSDGGMVANIRCDSCLRWDGGSMNPTSSSSDWIWAVKEGDALSSSDLSEGLSRHDTHGHFTFDLSSASGPESENPFVRASSASDDPDIAPSRSSSSSSKTDSRKVLRPAHGIVMAVVFLILFPAGALTVYLPFGHKIAFVHAPLQVLSMCLLIAGLALGIVLGIRIRELDEYHQVIGYITTACLILFQPLLGLVQHRRYKREHNRVKKPPSFFGVIHRWLGRSLIVLGIINGGLGLYVSGPAGESEYVPIWSVVVYSLVAALVGVIYLSLVLCLGRLRRRKATAGKSGSH